MGNRKATEAFILKYIGKLAPKSDNVKIYTNLFKSMNDEEFHQFMLDLKTEAKHLPIILPNMLDSGMTVESNLNLAKELNYDFFQRIWIGETDTMPSYLSPIKYLVLDLPLRRASQMLVKKLSVPENSKVVDRLTGQPTGNSGKSKVSYPEMQVLATMGLDNSIVELMKYRGGDNKGFLAMNSMISRLGSANIKTLKNYASGVESTKTLKIILTAMHIKSTL